MCCGHPRTSYRPARSGGPSPDPAGRRTVARRSAPPPSSRFRYTGATALTVRGPISGRLYRFDGPGVSLEVDPRDAAAVATVPGLEPERGRRSATAEP